MAPRGIPNDITTATRPMISPPIMRSFFCAPLRRCFVWKPLPCKGTRGKRKKFPEIRKLLRLAALAETILLVGWSVDLVNLHGCVDGKIGVSDRGPGGSRSVPCGRGEAATGAFDGIGIAVAFGAGHGQRMGGDEFVQQDAAAVQRDVAAFRLSDLEQVAAHARKADRLCGSCALIRGWHFLQIKVVYAKKNGSGNEDHGKGAHRGIVASTGASRQVENTGPCVRKQRLRSPLYVLTALVHSGGTPNPLSRRNAF